jgi:hypothetical protein
VTPVPWFIVIGLKVDELVKAKVVKPSKVTVVPVLRLRRLIVSLAGIAIFERTIFVQEATAAEIWEKAVAVHIVDVGATAAAGVATMLETRAASTSR